MQKHFHLLTVPKAAGQEFLIWSSEICRAFKNLEWCANGCVRAFWGRMPTAMFRFLKKSVVQKRLKKPQTTKPCFSIITK